MSCERKYGQYERLPKYHETFAKSYKNIRKFFCIKLVLIRFVVYSPKENEKKTKFHQMNETQAQEYNCNIQ